MIGAILMGMVTGLVASPCVGPVLVVLLTFVAKTGSLLLGFWLLFTFACGLGLLFLVLGTFAGAIGALPGAGALDGHGEARLRRDPDRRWRSSTCA